MKIFSELKIGDKLSIEVDRIDENIKQDSMLNTQLMDMDNESIYISPPIYMGKKYFLRRGQGVTLFFYRKGGVYKFKAEVVRQNDANILTFMLKPIEDIVKIQRRDHYRLPIVLPTTLKRIQKDKVVEFSGVTKDLSGGGVKIICKEVFQIAENVTLLIYLDENQATTVNGEIIRVIKDMEKNSYELGIKFKEIDPVISDKIFAFIFEKQRLMRKKGLI